MLLQLGRVRGLERVLAGPGGAGAAGGERHSLLDLVAVPARAVLVLQEHHLAARVEPSVAARVVKQHQREEAGRLRLVRHQRGEHPGEPDGLVAELAADEPIRREEDG